MPHPIKLFGHIIAYLEKYLNRGVVRKLKGALMSIFLVIITYLTFFLIKNQISFNIYVDVIISSIFIFYGLANRNLIYEVLKVNRALSNKGLEAGRKQLSFIVGRDTSKLDEHAIRRASLETLAENLSDGIIAPMFYLFFGGFPLMLVYKMVNTLDSMIGYKNERYMDFGWFAAKTDDFFNFFPARITALLIAIVSFKYKSFQFILKYGNKHSSPNAGYPESAMAGALNCRFGGAFEYYGKIIDKPYIGETNRKLSINDIKYACWINLKASFIFLILGVVMLYFVLT